MKIKIEEVTGGFTGHVAYLKNALGEFEGQAKTKRGAIASLLRNVGRVERKSIEIADEMTDLYDQVNDFKQSYEG